MEDKSREKSKRKKCEQALPAVKIKKEKSKESATAPLCPPNDEGKKTYFFGKEREKKKRRKAWRFDGWFRKF